MNVESLQRVLLWAAGERSLDGVLQAIVGGLADQPHAALARIWLVGPGDICKTCPVRSECPDQRQCLHLVASAGRPSNPKDDWSGIDGTFRRFPLGVRKIGRIGASAEPIFHRTISPGAEWLRDPEWARSESIKSFAGQPLLHKEETLGVLGFFSRSELEEQDSSWIRMFADHAAAAIANARAYEEIEHLHTRLEEENVYLREEMHQALSYGDIVGHSPALQKTMQQVELVAPTDANVLIVGESGTGKELIARQIHDQSRRRDRAMIKVNCASIPRDLFESEFFGHVKGSFTGAISDRVGRFQLAHGGTLFLDEVGEIPLELQSKLLRVLQEGEFEPVGETKSRKSDARIIAATNRDLYEEVRKGNFRDDLYYRLSGFPIAVPPLRERPDDIPALATHFVALAANKFGVTEPRITNKLIDQLINYDWPGNVRELQHVLERAVIMAKSGVLRLESLEPRGGGVMAGSAPGGPSPVEEPVLPLTELRKRERENIIAALREAQGKIYGAGGAAQILGLKPTTLTSRLKALGINKNQYKPG